MKRRKHQSSDATLLSHTQTYDPSKPNQTKPIQSNTIQYNIIIVHYYLNGMGANNACTRSTSTRYVCRRQTDGLNAYTRTTVNKNYYGPIRCVYRRSEDIECVHSMRRHRCCRRCRCIIASRSIAESAFDSMICLFITRFAFAACLSIHISKSKGFRSRNACTHICRIKEKTHTEMTIGTLAKSETRLVRERGREIGRASVRKCSKIVCIQRTSSLI